MKIITFGCRMNTFESAVMAEKLPESADVVIVNTCAVTAEAERQGRQAIRRARREYPNAVLIATGCAVQLNPKSYQDMPEVDRVLGNREKLQEALLKGDIALAVDDIKDDLTLPIISHFEGRTRAFLQIQQGCDHHCTFCIVRFARGKNRGLSISQIIEQARTFTQNGFNEIVLTGADIVSHPDGFCRVVRLLLEQVPEIKRLRFGSLDPAPLKDDFVDLVHDFPQIMPYFHFSIQSGDDTVLKRMGRRHKRQDVLDLIKSLKKVRPNATFGADLITGFPGETDEQFKNTLDLVKKGNISHLHVFPYSERPGTPAIKLKPVISVATRKRRAKILRDLGQELTQKLYQKMQAQKVAVLVESDKKGWTENYLPVILDKKAKQGEIIKLTIKGYNENGLVG
ncbi:MAG: tRNA (N(6)-L-threonylcarbamoyladenosine(37)-C(2))-methylthiotransferase MtaB [Alphaproteobacteria bacterium]|nr:tRNA (N(6)-L-threonylcarbamoyladenosine(37)-C(2))-methylthiotransferase MtaB [Alphaproteobacteria bacterium]